jgi:hypothetical protein
MTLPDERTRATLRTRQFLLEISSGEIKRIPREVRARAKALLRHYPTSYDIEIASIRGAHTVFDKNEARKYAK